MHHSRFLHGCADCFFVCILEKQHHSFPGSHMCEGVQRQACMQSYFDQKGIKLVFVDMSNPQPQVPPIMYTDA
eukprot:1156892-Pelagomonas_calceolata.AAC.9